MKKNLIIMIAGMLVSVSVFAQGEVKKAKKELKHEIKQPKKEITKPGDNVKVDFVKDVKNTDKEIKKEKSTAEPTGR